MVFVETSFPRGGTTKNPANAATAPAKVGRAHQQPDIEFGATTFKRKREKLNKKQREEKHIRDAEERTDKVEAISAELLSLKTISEGMLCMGSISKIDATHLIVSLPGRLTGRVLVTAMAPAYIDIVNRYVNDVANVQGYKTLDEMYTIGQIVCVRVMEIKACPDQPRALIELSMNPATLQSEFQHKKVHTNAVLCAAVSDIEDHGYVLNAGIPNLRAFMPLSEARGADLGVGEIVFCRVQQAKTAAAASTVVCQAISMAERTPLVGDAEQINLAYVLPTSVVKFKVTKILRDGLQGTVLNDTFTAYANEHQLKKPLSSPEDYKLDDEVDARVLYVMPLTKLVYVSLNLSETIARTDSELRVGTIIEEARVTRIGTGGLIVKLNKRHKGLVSFRSLRDGRGYQSNFDTEELLAKFHKNSVHRVRVTGYDPMDTLYVCTTNEKLLAEKYFTMDDCEVGDFVDATIQHVLKDGGYFVKVGQVKAYVERVQISSSTPASKLLTGAKLRCRVIRKHAKDQKLFLTNRKEFMAEDTLLLKSCEKAVVGLDYHGMVVKIFADGYLVSFCQYVKGMLYKRNLGVEDAAAAAYYRVGQIAKFRVQHVRGDGFITLAMGAFVCQTGTVLAGKVMTVDENGLNVAFASTKMNGFVPAMLLTDFPALRPLMHQTYKSSEQVEAVCVAQNVFSVRDVERARLQPVKRWDDVRTGDILPAYVKDVQGDVIELMLLVEQYAKTVKCHVKMLLEDHTRQTKIDLVPEQLLFVRVLGKNNMLKQLTISARLSHVWAGDLRTTAVQFRDYFRDVQRVQRYCEKIRNAVAAVKPGSLVSGKVVEVEDGRAIVRLANNVTGVIVFGTNAEERQAVTLNATVECLAIWADYVENVVYVTAASKFVQRAKQAAVEAEADDTTVAGKKNKRLANARGLKADVLLVRDTVVVLQPRKLTGQFVYVPTRLHHNDLQPVLVNGVRAGDVANVTVLELDDEFTIGMFEHIHLLFGKFRVQREKNRRLQKLMDLLRDREVKEEENEDAEIKEEDDDEENEKEKTDAAEESLFFSGDVVKNEITEDDDNDDASFAHADAGDLFFEDTLGSLAEPTAAANGAKRADKRKAPVVVKTAAKKTKSKSTLDIKVEQMDGATKTLPGDGDDSDDEYDAKKAAKITAKVLGKNQKKILRARAEKATNKATAEVAGPTKAAKKAKQAPSVAPKTIAAPNIAAAPIPSKQTSKKRKFEKPTKAPTKLPGVSNFWSAELSDVHKAAAPKETNSSDDSDDDTNVNATAAPAAKKTKLSTADRFRMARTEEARVRTIEESYADPDAAPTTVDHHERLVMATPNSSLAWINYMVFHMQCNEIHRARLVARKAFQKISFRDAEELLNVWVALLNLELRYGDKEAFDAVLAEALRVNEPFKVYARCLAMLVSTAKVDELLEMVQTFTKKFRAVAECWTVAAATLCEVELVDKVQPLLNRALASLPERDHVSTIVKFAQLNNKHNNRDRAHALMEQILTAYPKRVDCWSQYVDMLVKDKEYAIARQILDRAIIQKIPMKKMRTLFKKYLDFETIHGDAEAVQKVKAIAASYVEKELKV